MNRKSSLLLLLCLLAPSTAAAQQLGITGRYGIGVLEGGRLTGGWREWCGCDDEGSAFVQGVQFAAAFHYRIPFVPIGTTTRIGVGTSAMRFISIPYATDRTDLPDDALLEYRESTRALTVRVDLEGAFYTSDETAMTFGPWAEFAAEPTLERTERILAPAGAVFPGATDERVITDAIIARQPELRWGASLGVSYAIRMSPAVQMVPFIALDADFAGIVDRRPGALMFNGGSSFLIDLRGAPAAPVLAMPEPEAPAAAPPTVSIGIYAIYDGRRSPSATVRRDLDHRRVVVAMPTSISFEMGSAALPERRDAERFTIDSLIGIDPLAIERHAIDLLGLRMRANEGSRIRLVGSWTAGEERRLGRERAEAVKASLVRTWGISPRRITISAAAGEQPAVGIVTSSEELISPVVVEWLDERFVMPPIELDPAIEAPSGVRTSSVRLVRRGSLLAVASIDRRSTVNEIAVDLSDAIDADTAAPILALLDVTDSSGATARATGELRLVLPRDEAAADPDREVGVYVLDECASRSCRNDAVLAELRRNLRSGARVRVRYAPRHARQTLPRAPLDDLHALLANSGATVDEAIDTTAQHGRVVVEVEQVPERFVRP
jgi:hypothetical protein